MNKKNYILFLLLILIFFIGCQNNSEKIILRNGWYTINKDGILIKSLYMPDDCCNYYLSKEPFIKLDSIQGIEINTADWLDDAIEIFFNLSYKDSISFRNILKTHYGEEIVFVLNNKAVNFWKIGSSYYRYGDLRLTLGYSDFSKEQVENIINEIKRGINQKRSLKKLNP